MNYFITGTDTDCGKTFVTALLVRAARAAGLDAVGAKPFCCGPRDDVEILVEVSGNAEQHDAINPVWMKTPAAPRACELLGEPAADVPRALAAMRGLAVRHAGVFCEGVGGWLVPVAAQYSMADFAKDLGWPVIVVVRDKLGALNHALLTVESVRGRGMKVAGLILNRTDHGNGSVALANEAILAETPDVSLLTVVGPGQAAMEFPERLLW